VLNKELSVKQPTQVSVSHEDVLVWTDRTAGCVSAWKLGVRANRIAWLRLRSLRRRKACCINSWYQPFATVCV